MAFFEGAGVVGAIKSRSLDDGFAFMDAPLFALEVEAVVGGAGADALVLTGDEFCMTKSKTDFSARAINSDENSGKFREIQGRLAKIFLQKFIFLQKVSAFIDQLFIVHFTGFHQSE